MTEISTVTLYFYGTLHDFLTPARQSGPFRCPVTTRQALSDVIQSVNVPHTEIGRVTVNGRPARLRRALRPGDAVRIWPDRKRPKTRPRFVLDVHLGKLVKYLRLLGLDTVYRNNASDRELAGITAQTGRYLLTRDVGLLKRKSVTRGYWLRETDARRQARELVRRFGLRRFFRPFLLCPECNGRLRDVAKSRIEALLPLQTREYYHRFRRCGDCRKIYWAGSHFREIERFIRSVGG